MSDVIVQRFEADSADFVREVNKARESVRKMTGADLPLVRQELNSAFTQAQRTAQGMNQMGREARGSAGNLLIMAQVADDAQYGMRGLSNQIPQLAMALGAGAGLAGAVSLVTLALWKGIPLFKEFYLNADSEAAVKAARAYGVAVDENLGKLRAVTAELEAQQQIAAAERGNMASARREATPSNMVVAIERRRAAIERERKAEDELTQARERAELAEAEMKGGDVGAVRANQARDRAQVQARRAAEDAKLLEELMRISTAESERIGEAGRSSAAGFAESIKGAEAELSRLERNEAFSKAAAAQAQAEFDAVKDKGYSARQGETKNQEATAARAALDEKAVKAQREKLESMRRQAEEQARMFADEARALAEKANQAAEQLRDWKAQAIVAGQVAQEAEREREAQRGAAEQAKAKAEAEKRATEAKQAAVEAQRAAEARKREGMAREDVMVEVRALELQARGREKEANALRDALRMKREVAELVERAAISEAQATQIVERKFALERALTGEKEKAERGDRRRDGRIRLFDRGESAGGAFAARDLGKSVIERNVLIAQQRGAALRGESPALNQMGGKVDDLHATMKKMLGVWENVSAK